ncbi:hypothetical protein KIW84_061550 [Lathyrus oleraceus]|uniref:Uncharacterized protein n=1 Tax=Pisum sativum TaxID=3888 RepID=A0A9D4W3D1_PEA|nr:hypothetical protein KIW84_061550 [Pisum sativum]
MVKSAASTHSLGEPLASSQRAIPVAKPPKLAGAKGEAWASPSEGFVRLANMPIWQRTFLWAQVPQVPHFRARYFHFMRGQIPVDELLFDPEIERTARRLNSRTRRRRQQARQRQEQGESSSTTHPPPFIPIMEPPPPPISTPCVNSPRNTAQFANHTGRQAEMKTGTLIFYMEVHSPEWTMKIPLFFSPNFTR